MAEKKVLRIKNVRNPLLSLSSNVTIDDYNQNAILYPASTSSTSEFTMTASDTTGSSLSESIGQPISEELRRSPPGRLPTTNSLVYPGFTRKTFTSTAQSQSQNFVHPAQSQIDSQPIEDNTSYSALQYFPLSEDTDSVKSYSGTSSTTSFSDLPLRQHSPNNNTHRSVASSVFSSITSIFTGQNKTAPDQDYISPCVISRVDVAVDDLEFYPGYQTVQNKVHEILNDNPNSPQIPLYPVDDKGKCSIPPEYFIKPPVTSDTGLLLPPVAVLPGFQSKVSENCFRRQTKKKLSYAPFPGLNVNPVNTAITPPNLPIKPVEVLSVTNFSIDSSSSEITLPKSEPLLQVNAPSLTIPKPINLEAVSRESIRSFSEQLDRIYLPTYDPCEPVTSEVKFNDEHKEVSVTENPSKSLATIFPAKDYPSSVTLDRCASLNTIPSSKPVSQIFIQNLDAPVPEQNQGINSAAVPFSYTMTTASNEVPSVGPAVLNSDMSSHTIGSTPLNDSELPHTHRGHVHKTLTAPYRPVYHHWFHRREVEGRVIWQPFSMVDSLSLESTFMSVDLSPEHMAPTDGGRYDVNILRRQRSPVYWDGTPTEVRRCSWFFKASNDGRYTPYEENVAAKLEAEYKIAYESNEWHCNVQIPTGENIMFHGPDVLVLFPQAAAADVWGSSPPSSVRPRVVKRGMDEFDIDEGEPAQVDHLLFLVHGIGSVCDLKFRSLEEVVDDFRSISLQLVQSHYKSSCEHGIANRIEVLPVSWHKKLHSEGTGIDKKLKAITLDSIPRLRDFTNDTLLDILFYSSPVYCQTIISTVGTELNRLYDLFRHRNPSFHGNVSVGGHSLGSLILFDLLCHQKPNDKEENISEENGEDDDTYTSVRSAVSKPYPAQRRMSRRISYMMGVVGTGQPELVYTHLNFNPTAFFALGSPVGMFVTIRGLDSLGEQFAFPTCPAFFNIFHPYDPVAYRIEALVNPALSNVRPVLIPHHKGRKRMHLELKETMARVGADLKQRILDSMRTTWNSVFQLNLFGRQEKALEAEVDKVLEEQLHKSETPPIMEEEVPDVSISPGNLNRGRRIDYVLQEAPLEFFNEYIFALTSHCCYWESEDTMLLILKEIYSSMGIESDNQIPQQSLKIERTPSPRLNRKSDLGSLVAGNHTLNQSTEGPTVSPEVTHVGFIKRT